MSLLIVSILTSFITVLFGMPPLIKVARLKQLVDKPGNDRKLHSRSTPNVGGVIIFAATIFTALAWLTISDIPLQTFRPWIVVLSAAVPIFFMGLKDDPAAKAFLSNVKSNTFVSMTSADYDVIRDLKKAKDAKKAAQ